MVAKPLIFMVNEAYDTLVWLSRHLHQPRASQAETSTIHLG
jgi:hypothetical protein